MELSRGAKTLNLFDIRGCVKLIPNFKPIINLASFEEAGNVRSSIPALVEKRKINNMNEIEIIFFIYNYFHVEQLTKNSFKSNVKTACVVILFNKEINTCI